MVHEVPRVKLGDELGDLRKTGFGVSSLTTCAAALRRRPCGHASTDPLKIILFFVPSQEIIQDIPGQ